MTFVMRGSAAGSASHRSVAIIGAGPAGLSAAYALLKGSSDCKVTVYEKEPVVGGLSRTFEFEGGRVDIGGHRFFSRNPEVLALWEEVLPSGPEGMLLRDRASHILWNSRLIGYPIQLDLETLRSLGVARALRVVASYLRSMLHRENAGDLESFYVNRFGGELYKTFFRDYTSKLWGLPASAISSDWGSQRVRKVSLGALLGASLSGDRPRGKERSLIGKYLYPAYGSGQLWSALADKVTELGGEIVTGCSVERLSLVGNRVEQLECVKGGERFSVKPDHVISSMPLSDLAQSAVGIPPEVKQVCDALLYRDMVIVAVSVKKSFKGAAFEKASEDSWLYLQDSSLRAGRCQILNNWSPAASRDQEHLLLEMEYYCAKGDSLWEQEDPCLAELALRELVKCGLCEDGAFFDSYLVRRIEKAYPVYTGAYHQLSLVENWACNMDNLICVGRNGQHRYNNMDHSVECGLRAARALRGDTRAASGVWFVNRGEDYIEEPSSVTAEPGD